MKKPLTDIHQHLLWGLDDGAKSSEIMQKMLGKAARQGITRIAATPHATPGFEPFDMGKYRERLAEAQSFCKTNDLSIKIFPGAEVMWTYQTVTALRQGAVPTLAGTDHVLLELPYTCTLNEAREAVQALRRAGYLPVLAHVERYRCFSWSPRDAVKFHEQTGAAFQMNAGTLLYPHGLMEKHFVRVMLDEYCLDAVATDAHGRPERPINLRAAYKWLRENTDADYADELVNFLGDPK